MSSARQTIERSTSLALSCLALAFFTLGASSFCVVGAFDYIADDWHLSRTATALLVTAFSGTLGLCAPLLQMLVGQWPRRSQILTGMSVMATGAMVMALAPNYPVLFAARVLMGLGAALATPMILALGSTLVEPHLQGRAIATVMMGITVASVVSVPASTWAAAHIGPRWLFASIGFATVIAVVLIAFFVRNRSPGVRVKLAQFVDLVRRPANISGLSVVFCSAAGSFVTYTMITPILRDRYSAGPHLISFALLVYGIAGIGGNLIVGRAATSFSAERLLAMGMTVLAVVFAALLILPISIMAMLVALTIWPAMVAIIWPSQQRRMVELEPQFRAIALALNSTFFFFGVAAGSFFGGVSYSLFGYSSLLIFSILLTCIGLVALRYSKRAKALQTMKDEVLPAGISRLYAGPASLALAFILIGIRTGYAQSAPTPTPTTKILAIGTINPGVDLAKANAILPAEAKATVNLYLEGKIDQWYSLQDRKGVAFILNVTNPAVAREMLEKLPLGQAHIMRFDLIPLGPLNPLRKLP